MANERIGSAKGNEVWLYVGSYGEKGEDTIHVCSMDGETGQLRIEQKLSGVEQASFLALHPNGRKLYAVKEIAEENGVPGGTVVALDIDAETGRLGKATSQASTGGAHPCYVSVDAGGHALFAANYSGGSVALFALDSEGEFGEAAAFRQHAAAPGPFAGRQEAPHAHCIEPLPGTPFVYAADLGMDAIVVYRVEPASGKLEQHQICKLHPGGGPRHIVFHPELPAAYVTNELDSTVTRLAVDRENGTLQAGNIYSTVPADYDGYNDAADLHLSPDGRYLYTSNRGHNSIAVFAVDGRTGELEPVQHIGCGGELPRNFGITPDGRYLLAANQRSGSIVVFRRDADTGTLAPTGGRLELPSPVCIRFRR